MVFTEQEAAYLRTSGLGRLATVSGTGQPDVVPVAVEFDGTVLWVGGTDASVLNTRKFRNVRSGSRQVALVVDDVVSLDPFIARGLRVYGRAQAPYERAGMVGPGVYMAIAPETSWSWNLAGEPAGDTWYPVRRRTHT